MKRMMRLTALFLAILLSGIMVLTACEQNPPEEEKSSSETSNYEADVERALPVLDEKFVSQTPEAGDFLLVEEKTAKAKIVLSDHKEEKAEKAAWDLQYHISEMTGVVLPLISESEMTAEGNYILVGMTEKTKALGVGPFEEYPGEEKLVIKRKENYLILCGNDSGNYTGTQFAVNRFLEEAGCGWFAADPLWQVIPSCESLGVDEVDLEQSPRFSSRRLNRLDANLSSRWYLGGQVNHIGHGVPGLIPVSVYYEEHPEWFALVDGSRDPNRFTYWQYCYTNEELAKEVAERIISIFDARPMQTNYSIAANDGWEENWCECERCVAAGSDTDELLIFANNVAKIVGEKYPDRQISILAYHTTFFPPVKEKALPNVEVMFCLETSLMLPLDEGHLIPTGFNSITHNTYTQSWKDSVSDYITNSELQHKAIWGWYCLSGTRAGWDMAPWVQGNVTTRNLELFEAYGVDDVFYDAHGDEGVLRWPLWYPTAVGMWDDSRDAETLLYDACQKLYGAAAEDMFLYYRCLADAAEHCKSTFTMTWVAPYLFEVYHPYEDVISRHIDAAWAKADQLSEEQRERVKNQRMYWGVTRMGM